MKKIKIYKITVTKAFLASLELGTRYSLEEWGENTREYEGYDEEIEVFLEERFEVVIVNYGKKEIYEGEEHCQLIMDEEGGPAIQTSKGIVKLIEVKIIA